MNTHVHAGRMGAVALALLAMLLAACSHADHSAELAQSAAQANKTLPKMVNGDVRLDQTQGGPGNNFTYYYTLTSHSSMQMRGKVSAANLKKSLESTVCTKMSRLFHEGVTVSFVYRGIDGGDVARVDLKPADCGIKPD